MNEDMTYCPAECPRLKCLRNKKHIRHPEKPHSYFVEKPKICVLRDKKQKRLKGNYH